MPYSSAATIYSAGQMRSLFSGNKSFFCVREMPSSRQAKGNGKKSIVFKRQPLGSAQYAEHLRGGAALCVCPADERGECGFGALDIDDYDGQKAALVLRIIESIRAPVVPFWSASGGLHIYAFFAKRISISEMQQFMRRVAAALCLPFIYGKDKVEIFPKNATACLTLPYWRGDGGYTGAGSASGARILFEDAMKRCRMAVRDADGFDKFFSGVDFLDAPPCIYGTLKMGLIGRANSGRNEFLYNVGVYLKKKRDGDFEGALQDVNASFEVPLSVKEVSTVAASVARGEKGYKCSWLAKRLFCDKRLCSGSEYGLFREKGHFTGVEYGQLTRYKTLNPYYKWQLRINDVGEFADVVFPSEKDLMNQAKFQEACVRCLNFAPSQVAQKEWVEILNNVLRTVKEEKVPVSMDSSGIGRIDNLLTKFLARANEKTVLNGYMIYSMPMWDNDGGVKRYYFKHDSFVNYMNVRRIKCPDQELFDVLAGLGCRRGVFQYWVRGGVAKEQECWVRDEDAKIREESEAIKDIKDAEEGGGDFGGGGLNGEIGGDFAQAMTEMKMLDYAKQAALNAASKLYDNTILNYIK